MSEPRTYRLVRFSDLMASETMVTMVTQLRNEADKVERCPGYEYHHTASLLRYAAAKISLLTRELEEARRERSAARAEVLTAQASLRRVERVLEEARERIVRVEIDTDGGLDEIVTRGHGHLERLGDGDLHLVMGPVALRLVSRSPITISLRDGGDFRALVATPDTEPTP